MPSVEANIQHWNDTYDWSGQGDEWSAGWGGTHALWKYVLLPRISGFVPAESILEIAPGFGRWTQYLKDLCEHLEVVDLSATCIDACRRRFATERHVEYHVNDGRSLAAVSRKEFDFVFSFDSLVHADADVMQAYVTQLGDRLSPNGVVFFHHSNFEGSQYYDIVSKLRNRDAAHDWQWRYEPESAVMSWLWRRLPAASRDRARVFVDNANWRGPNMSAAKLVDLCERVGLAVIGQELVAWGSPFLTDCFSIFTPRDSRWARPNRLIKNREFMRQARQIQQLSWVYDT